VQTDSQSERVEGLGTQARADPRRNHRRPQRPGRRG
jgi:hypothetical protein